VNVAGQVTERFFEAIPNQSWTFEWDGFDGYGRRQVGGYTAVVTFDNFFVEQYAATSTFGGVAVSNAGIAPGGPIRRTGHISKRFEHAVSAPWSGRGSPVGGWTLSQHHVYDPGSKTVLLGTGERIQQDDALGPIRDTIAGYGLVHPSAANNTPVELLGPYFHSIAPAGDGGWWALAGGVLLKVEANGLASVVLGNLNGTAADLDVGPRGEVYISLAEQRVKKYDPETGEYTIFAGTGTGCSAPLTGPALATEVDLCAFPEIAATPDGNVYVTANQLQRIYRISTDGLMHPFMYGPPPCPDSHGTHRWCVWNVPASQAVREFNAGVGHIAAGPDSSLYVNAGGGRGTIVMRVGADGIVRRFLGGGGLAGDGVPPLQSNGSFGAFFVAPDGQVYYSYRGGFAPDGGGDRFRSIVGGVVVNIAGHGFGGPFPWEAGPADDGKPAEQALHQHIDGHSLALDDGTVLYNQFGWIRVLRTQFPGFGDLADRFIASPDGTEVWHFNGVGRHLETLHALTGAVLWSFGYDAEGNLISMTDGDGNVTTIERVDGVPVSITGPFGQVTELETDAEGFLESVTNPNNETIMLDHSPEGLLESITTPRGDTYTYSFSGDRKLESAANPAGGSQTLESLHLLETAQRKRGHEVTRSTILGPTTTAVVEWLHDGRRVQTIHDPDGTTFTTESANGAMKTVGPTGVEISTIVLPDPRFGMQAPLGASTVKNTPGGLTLTTSQTQTVTLSDLENPFSIMDLTDVLRVNGRDYETVYDGATRTFTHTTPEGRTSTLTIDQLGRPVAEQLPGLPRGTVTYDTRGRLEEAVSGEVGPDQRRVLFGYNAEGYLESITDPAGRVVSLEYDDSGRLVRQSLPGGREVAFEYDANGNLVSLTPPGRTAHTFTYNEVDLPLSYVPPVVAGVPSPATLYTYNLDQQPTSVTRPDGLVTQIGYDAAGRLSTITFSRGIITLTYDVTTGQLVGISAPGGQALAFDYTGELLTLETWSGPVAGSLGYSYDNDFRVTSQTVNGANAVTFGYDGDSLLTQAGALTLDYDPANGLFTGSTLDTITESVLYNLFAEPASYEVSAGATPIYGVEYTYDELGRIETKTETLDGVTTVYEYSYDAAGRLQGVEAGGAPVSSYTYDLNGNRLSGPGAETASYDAQDRMLTYGANTYAYDASGDLDSRTDGAGTTTYEYDELGNLMGVDLPDGTEVDYIIDGAGRRVGRMVDGTMQQGWLYDGDLAIVAELDGSGAVVSRFVHAGNGNMPAYVIQGGVTYSIISDHLGSLRLVARASDGHVVQRMNHDEFGRVTEDFVEAGFTRVPFGFGGGLYDPLTGLVRFGARDYDPETGRWTTKDPIGFAARDSNLYAYAANDPVNLTDPEGLVWTWDAFKRAVKSRSHAFANKANPATYLKALWTGIGPFVGASTKILNPRITKELTVALARSQHVLNLQVARGMNCPPKVIVKVRLLGFVKKASPPLTVAFLVVGLSRAGNAAEAGQVVWQATPVSLPVDLANLTVDYLKSTGDITAPYADPSELLRYP
jgi:RHS repeat-associated protein